MDAEPTSPLTLETEKPDPAPTVKEPEGAAVGGAGEPEETKKKSEKKSEMDEVIWLSYSCFRLYFTRSIG